MKMATFDFTKPQRENSLAIIFSAVFLLRNLIATFWPLAVLYVFKDETDLLSDYRTYIGAFVFLLLIGIHGYLSWKNFFFYIKDNEFIVEKGYLKKSIIALPLAKIVSVNSDQKLMHQLLNVVEVKIDSAGTKEKEVKLKAVKKSYALALEEAIGSVSRKYEETIKREGEDEIIMLSPLALLKIGIARNHLQGLALLLVFINQIYHQIEDFFKQELDEVISETTNTLEHSDMLVWIGLAVFILVLSFLISIARTFLSFFALKLLKVKGAFLIQSGLLKRKKITIPFSRIQAYEQSINPLQRLLQIATVHLIQANSENVTKDKEKVLIPGCGKEQIKRIKSEVFPYLTEKPIVLKPHWALRNKLFFKSLIFAVVIGILAVSFVWFWWLMAIYLVYSAIIAHIGYKKYEYFIDKRVIHVKKGVLPHKDIYLENYKIQAVRISQTIFQRRRDTASLHLGLAGTEVSLDYIPYNQAVQIKDFLLYTVIESKKDWF